VILNACSQKNAYQHPDCDVSQSGCAVYPEKIFRIFQFSLYFANEVVYNHAKVIGGGIFMSQTEKRQLFDFLASLHTGEEIETLLRDLCTDKEIEYMAQRLECARLLLRGKTYQQASQLVSVSSATMSRVNRCVRYGGGGYSKLLAQFVQETEDGNESK
jgi:TrpR-related protein YerC/YecD